ncbi:MAG: DVUA0089 family protein [Betaproteobacteria bacterium]|nr:DVUA0089 family protein [Betaproteobacteria bacterium]
MKMKLLPAAILAVGLFSATAAVQAATVEYTGTLSNGTDYAQVWFEVNNAFDNSGVTLFTDYFNTGVVTPTSNFDPYLAVWNAQGDLIAFNDNISNLDWNASIDLGVMADGSYFFTISNSPYAPACVANAACNISEGFDMYRPVGGNWDDFRPGNPNAGYGGNWSVTVTGVVPEPETWAMLLAGLGMVGAVARRRRQK